MACFSLTKTRYHSHTRILWYGNLSLSLILFFFLLLQEHSTKILLPPLAILWACNKSLVATMLCYFCLYRFMISCEIMNLILLSVNNFNHWEFFLKTNRPVPQQHNLLTFCGMKSAVELKISFTILITCSCMKLQSEGKWPNGLPVTSSVWE